ncbi:MAG: glycosyltransferase [Helicobacteraceae bacterium]|nr:glycosyltransferase [Helicobacteraceae bacterium]
MNIPFFMRMESTLVGSPKGRFFKDIFINWIIDNASALLYVSTDNKNFYLEYGVNEDKLFSVPYTVDNSFFQSKIFDEKDNIFNAKKEIGLSEDYPIILYASKLTTRKRSVDLIESFTKLSKDGKTPPNAYLVFIGDGEERENLEKTIDKLRWHSHIKMLGFKNQTELPLYFTMCDIFVLPSQNEPFGLIVNEVMNASKPIIVTNEVGCAKDIVQDGVNGYIIDPCDIDELTNRLKTLIGDKELRGQMGSKSLDIINHWSYDEDINGLLEALNYIKKV